MAGSEEEHGPFLLLTQEHRVIEAVLECLDVWTDGLASGSTVEGGDLGRFVTFMSGFVDGEHHEKEEKVLFPIMVENGFSRESGPIAVMMYEHDLARSHARMLAKSAASSSAWTGEERRQIVAGARAYVVLLRRHIQKEESLLFPTALRHLPDKALARVAERCRTVEEKHARSEDAGGWQSLVEDLRSQYGPGRKSSSGGQTHTACREVEMESLSLREGYDYFYCDECKLHIPCKRVSPGAWEVDCPYCDGECVLCTSCPLRRRCFGHIDAGFEMK